jgi:hypothetical protein
MSVPSNVLVASFISMSMSILMTEGGRTEPGLGDIEHEAAELVGDSEGNNMSLLPALKLLMLPSRLLHETRREALLAGGEGIGPTSSANNICDDDDVGSDGCCCNWLCDPRRDKDRVAVSVPSSPINGRRRSINCGFDPETGKLRFFNSAFRSLTFISSSRTVIRVKLLGVVEATTEVTDSERLGDGEGAAAEQVEGGRDELTASIAAVKLLAASSPLAAAAAAAAAATTAAL